MAKTCAKCGVTKPTSEFYRQAKAKDGLGAYCKSCAKVNATASYRKLKDGPGWKEKKAFQCREYYQENREAQRAYSKAYREDPHNQRRFRDARLRSTYAISLERYDEMLAEQGNACAICRQTCPTGKALGVDHDHQTGQVRGLLCANCNGGIGMLAEDPDRLNDAARYLLAHQDVLGVHRGT